MATESEIWEKALELFKEEKDLSVDDGVRVQRRVTQQGHFVDLVPYWMDSMDSLIGNVYNINSISDNRLQIKKDNGYTCWVSFISIMTDREYQDYYKRAEEELEGGEDKSFLEFSEGTPVVVEDTGSSNYSKGSIRVIDNDTGGTVILSNRPSSSPFISKGRIRKLEGGDWVYWEKATCVDREVRKVTSIGTLVEFHNRTSSSTIGNGEYRLATEEEIEKAKEHFFGEEKVEKEHPKEGSWVVITKSDDNWIEPMDKYAGRIVQIGSIRNKTLMSEDVKEIGSFVGCDMVPTWTVRYDQGHFRLAKPTEIPHFNYGEKVISTDSSVNYDEGEIGIIDHIELCGGEVKYAMKGKPTKSRNLKSRNKFKKYSEAKEKEDEDPFQGFELEDWVYVKESASTSSNNKGDVRQIDAFDKNGHVDGYVGLIVRLNKASSWEPVNNIRKATPEEIKEAQGVEETEEPEYNRGEYVLAKGNIYDDAKIGIAVEYVGEPNEDYMVDFTCNGILDKDRGSRIYSYIKRKATEKEIAEALYPKGTWVRVVNTNNMSYGTIGEIYKVGEIRDSGFIRPDLEEGMEPEGRSFKHFNLEKSSKEEAIEEGYYKGKEKEDPEEGKEEEYIAQKGDWIRMIEDQPAHKEGEILQVVKTDQEGKRPQTKKLKEEYPNFAGYLESSKYVKHEPDSSKIKDTDSLASDSSDSSTEYIIAGGAHESQAKETEQEKTKKLLLL